MLENQIQTKKSEKTLDRFFSVQKKSLKSLKSLKSAKPILFGLLLMTTLPASAGEGIFGWVYGLDLQPKGTWEFEQRAQLTRGHATGTYDFWQSRTEMEYGVTNDFQLAAYLNSYSITAGGNYTNPDACDQGSNPCTGGYGVPGTANLDSNYRRQGVDGVSLEGIWRISNPVTSPIGLGLYIEPTIGQLADKLSTRLLLQSNFLDDRLVLAGNIHYEVERLKFDDEPIDETILDVLLGASYRFAPKWSAGIEYRFHNDFDGYSFNNPTQRAHFIGPNLHYATKDWWVTAAWRRQLGGQCWEPGAAECSDGKVWDSHGVNEYILKFGMPF